MTPQEYRPENKVVVAAVLAVTATYVYFLIFAQFGFLKAILAAGATSSFIKLVMTVMGLSGVAGSALAAWMYQVGRSRSLLATGFAGCAVAAGSSPPANAEGIFCAVALLVGLSTGFTTVTLACVLRRALGGRRLGAVIGLGTGLAYGFCNLPAVFVAGASAQALMAVLAAGAGMAATFGLKFDAPVSVPTGDDYAKSGITAWLVIFLALVLLDSAAFYLIQHTPELVENLWSGSGRLGLNAAMHLVAAVLAGTALDRRWLGRTVMLGAGVLLVACWRIADGEHTLAGVALLYTAGVSVYSTALVYYPAYSLRPWLATAVYAVAGWGGSALGIGLAETRPGLPGGLIAATGAVMLAGFLARHFVRRRPAGSD